ncbi:hypothetical protein BU15DRAFT_69261 [Melanogaster broomeanus]|nr:hypothetical protein BU15DRAFT_69261 [Melanogaster broomeanus]
MASQTPALFLGLPVDIPPPDTRSKSTASTPSPKAQTCGSLRIDGRLECEGIQRLQIRTRRHQCHLHESGTCENGISIDREKRSKRCNDVHASSVQTFKLSMVIFLSDGIAAVSDRVSLKCLWELADITSDLPVLAKDCRCTPPHWPKREFGLSEPLRRVTEVALEEQCESTVPLDFHEALESVQVVQTFLGVANSLRRSRGGADATSR